MAGENSVSIEVVYIAPDTTFLKRITLRQGATVLDAIRVSGFRKQYPDAEISERTVGVFSRKVGTGYTLSHNDRVEIYRPLLLTPNEIRLLRAQKKAKDTDT